MPNTMVQTGSVTFHWNFNGDSCANANVDTVQVQIAGTTTVWSCYDPVNQIEGTTVAGVPQGAQAYKLTGYVPTYDATTGAYLGDVPWFVATGTINVMANADNDTGPITLGYINPPASMAQSNIGLFWTFGGQTCAQTPLVDHVNMTIGGTTNSFPCPSAAGAVSQNYSAGSYNFQLVALDAAGTTTLYQSSGTATVDGVNSVTINSDMQSMVTATGTGNAEIDFTFGTSGQNCQQVNVDTLHYVLTDPTGMVIAGTDLTQSCMTSSGVSVGIGFSSLQPAVYYLYVDGYNQTKITYQLSGYAFTVVASLATSTYNTTIAALP
jgi:hypothetical protein